MHSTALQINGNDHYLQNVIVFDFAKVGVEVNGAANLLQAVHTWNGGGTGISLGTGASSYGAHQNRLLGCYLDYNYCHCMQFNCYYHYMHHYIYYY